MNTSSKSIIVLGGGVIGLQSAVSLLEAGYKVRLIAEYLPHDRSVNYTSPWAGAIWCPGVDTEEDLRQWDHDIYEYWDTMCSERADEAKVAGVHRCTLYRYWDDPPAMFMNDDVEMLFWFSNIPSSFAILPASKLPSGVKFGICFSSFCVNSPIYLSYLQSRVLALGGEIVQFTLESENGLLGTLKDAASKLNAELRDYVFVNALGMGARKLIGDDKMFPTRGQTVYVEGEATDITIRTGEWGLAYVIPRKGSGYTLLGGSQEVGNWNAKPDASLTANILKHCAKIVPELLDEKKGFTVISQQVGLRPSRTGGVRVETEKVNAEGLEVVDVVHSYGHGGSGYEKSISTARKVVLLVDGLRK